MKKLFAFILGGAFTASFAFADVSIGISGRGAARVFDLAATITTMTMRLQKQPGLLEKTVLILLLQQYSVNFLTILISALQQRTACLE